MELLCAAASEIILWFLARDRILANQAKWRRQLIDSPRCKLCDTSNDNSIHIGRDYVNAASVWTLMVPHVLLQHFFLLGSKGLDLLELVGR